MRRRIRPATEDLEPRLVLSVGALTPRDADRPADDDRTESPEPEPADVAQTNHADVRAVEPTQDDRTVYVDVVRTETVDTQDDVTQDTPADVLAARLKAVRTLQVDSSENKVDTDLDVVTNVRDISGDGGLETTGTGVAGETHDVTQTPRLLTETTGAPVPTAQQVAEVTAPLEVATRPLSFLDDATAPRVEVSSDDVFADARLTSWIDSLQTSTLSLFGTNVEPASIDGEPLTEHTASAAGVAGVLSLMAFGRKGLGDSDRLFSGVLRGLLDLRDWRPTRSSGRRRQKSLPGKSSSRQPATEAPATVDATGSQSSFVVEAIAAADPSAFQVACIPTEDESVDSDGSQSEVVATTAAVGATVAAGSWAARQRSGGRRSKPVARPEIEFGGTTMAPPDRHVG